MSHLLVAPKQPHGAALGLFAVQVRRALQMGFRVVVVDESACGQWSPGQLIVLEHLRHLVTRCGGQWLTHRL